MIGMVFGSIGTPLAPWQAAQVCALASISSAAKAGAVIAAKIPTAPHRVKIKRLNTADTSLVILRFLSLAAVYGGRDLKRKARAAAPLLASALVPAKTASQAGVPPTWR